MLESSAVEPGEGQMGNVGRVSFFIDTTGAAR